MLQNSLENVSLIAHFYYLCVMNYTLLTIITFITSFVGVAIIHPYLVRFAKAKNIVDNPNTRKLQLRPVPVLGGLAIFFGIVAGLLAANVVADISSVFVILGCMMIMTYVGALDDVLDISPIIRLISEIVTVLILIYIGGLSLNNFHGVWGIDLLPEYISTPLTIVAVVGIINSLNLIDGADGLFSIFCISVCTIFGALFYLVGDYTLFALAVAAIGALIPFLLHNAFGIESKMFVGDGGSLQMGVVLSVFVMKVVCSAEYDTIADTMNISLVPFVLAMLSMPVFDTLRVMTARIARGTSPLIGDKTHLHHLFIGLGISHIGTSVLIALLNLCVVGAWYLSAQKGASADVQLYVVILAALLLDWGIYYGIALLDRLIPNKMESFRLWKQNHRPSRRLFDFMRKFVDKM